MAVSCIVFAGRYRYANQMHQDPDNDLRHLRLSSDATLEEIREILVGPELRHLHRRIADLEAQLDAANRRVDRLVNASPNGIGRQPAKGKHNG